MTMQPSPDRNGRPTALLDARLIDPGTGLDQKGGVLAADGVIVDLGAHVTAGSVGEAQVIDCAGHVPNSDKEIKIAVMIEVRNQDCID